MDLPEDAAGSPQQERSSEQGKHGNAKPNDKCHALVVHDDPLSCAG